MDDQQVLREIAPPDTNLAYAAMRELRTSLSSPEEFVDQVDLIQRPQGYRLVGVFHGEDVDAVSVAGFRQSTSLSWGRHIYVDDLSTIKSNRGQGFAGQLLAWIHDEAVRLAAARFTWIPASGRTVARPTGCT